MEQPHMVEQVIKYSDGTEKVIKYRGVIVDGVLVPDEQGDDMEELEQEVVSEAPVEVQAEASEPVESSEDVELPAQ